MRLSKVKYGTQCQRANRNSTTSRTVFLQSLLLTITLPQLSLCNNLWMRISIQIATDETVVIISLSLSELLWNIHRVEISSLAHDCFLAMPCAPIYILSMLLIASLTPHLSVRFLHHLPGQVQYWVPGSCVQTLLVGSECSALLRISEFNRE